MVLGLSRVGYASVVMLVVMCYKWYSGDIIVVVI